MGRMVSLLLLVVPILTRVAHVHGGDFIPERTCAILYSSDQFGSDTLELKDFDQSVNLKKDYRQSLNGWQDTGSIRVEDGCKMTICNETYFTGYCQSITADNTDETLELLISSVESVNCTCEKKCTCENINIPKDDFSNGFVGRAYINGDCTSCDAQYVNLYKQFSIPEDSKDLIEAFIIPKGCNITIYSEPKYEGQASVLPGPIYQGFKGTVGSYEIYCDEEEIEPKSPEPAAEHPLIRIPTDTEVLLQMLHSNDTLLHHSGLYASIKSAGNGRNPRDVYVVVIGDVQPYWLGFPQCRDGPWNQIGECRIPVELTDLGISAQVRVITVPIGFNSSVDDFRLMASLDEYLRRHEELNDAIPNAVIVYHWIHDEDYPFEDSKFQRRIHTVHQVRSRLLDEDYSNLVFMLNFLNVLDSPDQRRNPEERLALFEEELVKNWAFPRPINFCVKTGIRAHLRFVNGHVRMENEEYFPKNLETILDNIGDKGGDPLAQLIFKTFFLDNKTDRFSIEPVKQQRFSVDSNKASQCREQMLNSTAAQRAMAREVAQVQWKLRIHDLQHEQEIQVLRTKLELERSARLLDAAKVKMFEKLKVEIKKVLD